jgi:hypothetical protein
LEDVAYMTGYTKLFSSILTSSIWIEDDSTLRVWIALLALSDARGFAEGAVPGLASLCRMPIADTMTALAKLSDPDPYSRTPGNEGRRIAAGDGGWWILNYLKYREKGQTKKGSRAEYMRERRRGRTGQFVTRNSELLHVTSECNTVLHVPQKQKQKQKQIRSSNNVRANPPVSGSISERGKAEQHMSSTHHGSPSAPARSRRSLNAAASLCREVFEHWCAVMDKPRAQLDSKRCKLIGARLAEGYDVETLCRAIDGCRASLWHQGANDRGRKFDDIALICRDAQHVDQFLEIATKGEPVPLSRTTQHNLRALGILPTDPSAPVLDLPAESAPKLPAETEAPNDPSRPAESRPSRPRRDNPHEP